jgi:hypothetical protein
MGGLNKSDTSIWNKSECVPYGIKSTTFVNRNWFDTPIWNKFVTSLAIWNKFVTFFANWNKVVTFSLPFGTSSTHS